MKKDNRPKCFVSEKVEIELPPEYENVLGELDFFYEDGIIQIKLDNWDYPNKAVNILLAGKIWVTLSLEQAKELQKELNKVLI